MAKTLVIIGGGAAGFFCAVNAAQMDPDLQVVILEKTNKLLSKVKVSGGGRCNVTNACTDISELVKNYPRGQNFLKKAFHQFNPLHTQQWFSQHGISLKTEPDGRMFPVTNNSQTIIDCLLNEATKYNVDIRLNSEVKEVILQENRFRINLQDNNNIEADFLCIAGGGVRKLADWEWLLQFGHSIHTPLPSLFTFNIPGNTITTLMGISVSNAIVRLQGTKYQQQGALLITHWGLSGPAVLKLSAYAAKELARCNYAFNVLINWLPEYTEQSLRKDWNNIRNENARQAILSRNPFRLPARLWQYLVDESGVDADCLWGELPSGQQNKLIGLLTNQLLEVKGKTTFKEEFVTSGGIDLSEIDPGTMESRKIPNLFFAGEVMDVDGVTGGFNFQHAWTSGWIAAKAIASGKSQN